jgi:hypothetical protein
MAARLLLFFAMLLGIAVAPVRPVVECASARARPCKQCCAAVEHSCCAASQAPAQPAPKVPARSGSEDGKQLVPPSLVLLCLSPIVDSEAVAVRRPNASRLPARPLRDLHCIRLI